MNNIKPLKKTMTVSTDFIYRLKKECHERHERIKNKGNIKSHKYKHFELLLDKFLIEGSLEKFMDKMKEHNEAERKKDDYALCMIFYCPTCEFETQDPSVKYCPQCVPKEERR